MTQQTHSPEPLGGADVPREKWSLFLTDEIIPPRAKKRFSQNFLVKKKHQLAFIDALSLTPHTRVLEIGPGRGALTQWLVQRCVQVTAIEVDPRLVAWLTRHLPAPNLRVLHADILAVDLADFDVDLIVGNLPFHISSLVLKKLLSSPKAPPMVLTFQWEFAQRLIAVPGQKSYSALSCFVSYHAHVELLRRIPATAFQPRPKVDSGVVRITLRHPKPQAADDNLLWRLIQTAFRQRRKKIINALKQKQDQRPWDDWLRRAGIKPDARADHIPLEAYLRLTEVVRRNTPREENARPEKPFKTPIQHQP